MSDSSQVKPRWHALTAEAVAEQLQVDPAEGLSGAEAAKRLTKYGPNTLSAKKEEPGWKAFLRQYRDYMQLILVAAAAISLVLAGQVGTTIVLLALTVLNAVLGLHQESKAEESLAALQKMLKNIARVRRDGEAIEIDAEGLVPGDIVLMEAGNRVPADGRLFLAATLEIEEASLTGESLPTLKDTDPVGGTEVGLGDRLCLAFMNTAVTRGRGEMIVTTTGMDTQIGHIADLLNETREEKTPLQKRLDSLTLVFAGLAGAAFILMLILGLQRGDQFDELFVAGVALAISAIPTGMPVVITTLYSMGTRTLAEQHAIVKRLPSVETLGSVSAICSDKTGTLTLNKMTARELAIPGQNRYRVTGEGYDTQGQLLHSGGAKVDLDAALLPMALCADARLQDDPETGWGLIGDPTEGALIVLAEKGGIDVEATRERYPRVAEVPFDSDYKFMATFHEMTDEHGRPVLRCFVKGAPDVLIGRGSFYWLPGGGSEPITDVNRQAPLDENERMARAGERVMVVARRDFDPQTFDPEADLIGLVTDLTLMAMVGIVDPPRAEAKAAIAKCKTAGIQVRMITGDHAVTAAAIGHELGIEGSALTGVEFAGQSDEELAGQLPDIGVVARVAPDDKIRLVRLLQEESNVVAMTGDGVNDAPALKKADIGVAMGITGTEVSKDAAVMILTDDNFGTIVKAIEIGRALYANLSKFVRFQVTQLIGFIAIFLGASLLTIAGGAPFGPLVVLWVAFFVQTPLSISLGFDRPPPGLMNQKPRPLSQPLLSRSQWVRVTFLGLLIAAGTLILEASQESAGIAVAMSVAFVTFALSNIATGISARREFDTALSRDFFADRRQLGLTGLSLFFTLVATELGFLQRVLGLTSLSGRQWLYCIGFAVALLLVDEVIKFFLRRSRRAAQAVPEEHRVAAGAKA